VQQRTSPKKHIFPDNTKDEKRHEVFMSGPYLESGESIIMTTDRVSVDHVAYDAILTTRRLILMDSRYARFEPRIILLSTIESVRSGKAATGEPVIILALQVVGNAAAENKIIIFSQEPPENRKQDRDQWVQKFIELSVSSRDESPPKDPIPSPKPEGMRPSTRRWVAPEIIRPHTESHRVKEVVPEVEITPDETGPSHPPAAETILANLPLTVDNNEPENDGGNGYQEFLSRASLVAVQLITGPEPQVSPQQQRGPKGTDRPGPSGISPAADEPAQPEVFPDTPSPLSLSILAAARSLTAHKEQDEQGEPAGVPVRADIRRTSPLMENRVSPAEPVVVPETAVYVDTPGVRELPAYDEVPGGIRSTSFLPEVPAHTPGVEEPAEPVSRDTVPEPAGDAVGQSSGPEIPAAEENGPNVIPVTSPPAPASGMHPLLIGGIVLGLLLVLTGAVLLPGMLPQDHGPVTIVPTPVPTPTPGLIPVPSTVAVTDDGVWVRITSPGYFVGQAGNPGSLQPISGSGEKIYKIRDSNDLVKVSVEKQTNTGDILLVEISKDGRTITSRSVTAPMGSVDLLIDPVTEKPPGLVTTVPAGNSTGIGNGKLEYY
jgi:hypothetical protein